MIFYGQYFQCSILYHFPLSVQIDALGLALVIQLQSNVLYRWGKVQILWSSWDPCSGLYLRCGLGSGRHIPPGVDNVSWGAHGDDVVGEVIVWRDGLFLNGLSDGVVRLIDYENKNIGLCTLCHKKACSHDLYRNVHSNIHTAEMYIISPFHGGILSPQDIICLEETLFAHKQW